MTPLRRLLAERLRPTPPEHPGLPEIGDYDLNPDAAPARGMRLKPAGVLVPLIERAEGVTVLLTRRAAHLLKHAGQIAFPGGGMEPADADATAAALRETQEEVGIGPDQVEVTGYLSPYRTVTDYCVLPVVGFISPDAELRLDPAEVTEAFEVPFAFLMNSDNHERHAREWQGRMRHYYVIPFGTYHIWGATAAMLVHMHRLLYDDVQNPSVHPRETVT